MQRLLLATTAALVLTGAAYAQDRGFANRDDAAQMTTNGFLDRRDDVSPELFGLYWRDVHGPLAARIDGMHQYWQHHLDAPDAGLLPESVAASGVDVTVATTDRLEGLAEVTFASETDRAGLGASPAASQLMEDEQNAFKGTYLHSSVEGNTRTLVDHGPGAPQGTRDAYHAILLIAANETGDTQAFRDLVTAEITTPLVATADVVKVRYHLFEGYDASGWDTPNVDNDRTQDQAFDAWVEIAFSDRAAAQKALEDIGTALASPDLIAAIHAYPIRAAYTLVYDGRPTLAGLRGASVAETITAIGAENQRTLPVLQSMHGREVEAPVN